MLGHHKIHFGKYQGQTFKWLLENVLGYAVHIAASVELEGAADTPLGNNKQALVTYARLFPIVAQEVHVYS